MIQSGGPPQGQRPAGETPARRLRKLFEDQGIIRLAGAHNGLGACLAERAGFEGVWSSSLELSASYGVPDADILTMSEALAAAQSMASKVRIPVVADCDAGYGNSNNVINLVHRYEAAGVAAIAIEDKQFPKVNSFASARQDLATIAEFTGKVMAAKNAQQSPDLMVIARIEALVAGWGQREALRRARAYADAGADSILIHSKDHSPASIFEFLDHWDFRVPVVVVPTTYYSVTVKELQDAGVRMVIYANHGLRAAIRAVTDTFAEILQTGSTASVEERIVPMGTVFQLQGFPEFQRNEEAFLVPPSHRVRAVVRAVSDHTAKAPTTDAPEATVEVDETSLRRRRLEVLHDLGVNEVIVVDGEAHTLEDLGVEAVGNHEWPPAGEVDAILRADVDYGGDTLVVNTDTPYEHSVLQQLLRSEYSITVLVDDRDLSRGYARPCRHGLVGFSSGGSWPSTTAPAQRLRWIGQEPPAGVADGEFAGVALFRRSSFVAFAHRYRAACERAGPFHEAATARAAALTDVLQELVDQGCEIGCLVVSSGWPEARSSGECVAPLLPGALAPES